MGSTAACHGEQSISREELYRQVWQEPMTKLAPRYGLSDVGLAKVCRKHNIPRPPVGYWAKAGVGKHVEQPPLPELDDEALKEIHFFRKQFFGDTPNAIPSDQDKIVVHVADRLTDPHLLVVQTRQLFEAGKGQDRSLTKCLDIRVATASLPRALRILDATIKTWEQLGGSVSIEQNSNGDSATRFAIGKDWAGVALVEEMEREPSDASNHRYWRDVKQRPTGRLVLEISGGWFDNLRRRWADGKKQQLENILGSFLAGLQKQIAHEKERRLDNECEARQKQLAEEVRKEREQQQTQMERRRTHLEACAENWRKSREIRDYLVALETAIESNSLELAEPAKFPDWLRWAKWYADYLDPLTPTPIHDEYLKPPVNRKVEQLDLTRHTRTIVECLGVADADALSQIDRSTVHAASQQYGWRAWSEISRVLEGMRYDVSKRERSYL
ncbi:MAG: hypothetical protein AB7L90_26135 [Hyphomicrobiaceae bacterium]